MESPLGELRTPFEVSDSLSLQDHAFSAAVGGFSGLVSVLRGQREFLDH
ncbi:hypothetical protein SOVF_122520 [Spinacia oleracea]|nr:hypothetical protein SOVF_122520 [Spinacia oleracea]